ncbi:MAG: hypothetical protein R3B54_08005 [Bdellovibrionota bacterium]
MKYALALPRHRLVDRAAARTLKMVDGGLVNETQDLFETLPQGSCIGKCGLCGSGRTRKERLQ